MKRSFTSTLVLAVVLAGLVAWYLVYEKKMRPRAKETEEKAKALVTLDQGSIQELILERPKAVPPGAKPPATPEIEIVQLKKSGIEWLLVKPLEYPADGAVVGAMLLALTDTKQERVVDEKPKALEPFGLAPPKLKVSARKDAASPVQEISIGAETPVGFSNYAKVTGAEPVYRVPRTLFTSFDKDVKALRSKNIVSFGRFEVGEVEIQRASENLVVKKGEKDEWTLTRENLPVDNGEWSKTLSAVIDLKAKDFAAEKTTKLGDFGMSPPLVKVKLTNTRDQKKSELWLGQTKKGYFAKIAERDTIFEIEKEAVEKINRPASAYRDLRLANFNRFDIKRVKLDRGEESLELVKKDVNWTLTSDPAAKIDNNKVDGLLTHLQDVKAAKYLTGSSAVKTPKVTLSLYEGIEPTAAEKVQLKFGAPAGKQIAVQRMGLPLPLSLGEADWKKIDVRKADLLQPEPAAAPKGEAPKVPGAEPELIQPEKKS